MTHTCCHIKQFRDIPEIALKMRLENIFARELTAVFASIQRDFRTSAAAFGRAPDASVYRPRFESLLQGQYDRVQRAFRNDVTQQVMQKMLIKQDEDQRNTLIDLALLEWRNQNAVEKAQIITATNQRQMDQAVIDGRQALIDQEEEQTPAAPALASGVLVARQFGIRRFTIAQTETQESAEVTKQIEATALAGRAPFNLGPTFIVPTEDELA